MKKAIKNLFMTLSNKEIFILLKSNELVYINRGFILLIATKLGGYRYWYWKHHNHNP